MGLGLGFFWFSQFLCAAQVVVFICSFTVYCSFLVAFLGLFFGLFNSLRILSCLALFF
ncbi:hypothetical protein F4804DRAFT_326622 [Jackrogersella minutella]|nr:hypothetical protein F4804DRAFT_326622 [Jackrogersella minutella]